MDFFNFVNVVEALFITDVYKRYMWAYFVIGACCYAVIYAFEAVALFTIARRDGFNNKWMAFVPFFNTYYIGVVSEKNNIFRAKAKYVSLAAAILEAAYAVLAIIYFVAKFAIFGGGYAAPEYGPVVVGGVAETVIGYNPVNLPESLNWAWWAYSNLDVFVMSFVSLAYTILMVFVFVAFFRTYSSPRYVLFSIFSILFPIGGIFMFAVRNNAGKNYLQYIREQQQRQYNMYQQYMQNGQNFNGQNGYNGSYYGGNGNPYSQPRPNPKPDDPFGGLGEDGNGDGGSKGNGGSSTGGDPFDEFK